MAPMKRNRNRDRKNVVRRRVKNSGRKGRKYTGSSDGSRVERRAKRKITGYKLETTGLRKKRRYQRMGAGRLSKLTRGGKRGSSDRESDSRESEENRGRRYVRKALEFGLASGYLVPDEDSGCRVIRVASEIEQFAGGSGAERSGSEGRPDGSTERRGRSGRVGRAVGGKRLIAKSQEKSEQKNVRKRGRSRTKSPRKPAAQKRRKKLSESRTESERRVEKRKRTADVRKEQPSGTGRSAANEEGGTDDEDDEPDRDNDEDGDNNSDEKNNKLAVTSRPGSIVPNSDERPNDGDKKTGDDELSEPSGEEGSTEDEDEEEADTLREDGGLEEEDANEAGQEQNPNIE